MKNGLLSLEKQTLHSGVEVLEDVSQGPDVKLAIKRPAVEGAKEMGKKSRYRSPAVKIKL